MDVSISIAEKSVNLGQPVTVSYSSTGFIESCLVVDFLSTTINLGPGDVSGTIKLLPVVNGGFNVTIIGYTGDKNSDGQYYKQNLASAGVEVK